MPITTPCSHRTSQQPNLDSITIGETATLIMVETHIKIIILVMAVHLTMQEEIVVEVTHS